MRNALSKDKSAEIYILNVCIKRTFECQVKDFLFFLSLKRFFGLHGQKFFAAFFVWAQLRGMLKKQGL